MIWKLVLESYRANIHLCCAHPEGLDAAHEDGSSTERESGTREGRHRGKELRRGDISEGCEADRSGLKWLCNRLPIDGGYIEIECGDRREIIKGRQVAEGSKTYSGGLEWFCYGLPIDA